MIPRKKAARTKRRAVDKRKYAHQKWLSRLKPSRFEMWMDNLKVLWENFLLKLK